MSVRKIVRPIASYVAPVNSLSRPKASTINSTGTSPQSITVSLPGYNETIPLLHGEDRMAGLWLVRPYTHIVSGEIRFAILWCWGGEEGIEGVQELFANGANLPAGVTVTHYNGTPDQLPDPTLSADIPGFADRYAYAAYTVFRVPPATITGFPQTHQIEAVIRGSKVYDERIDAYVYSENPALAQADFITRPEAIGGMGKVAYNVAACADRCDQLLGTEPRCQLGLTIKQADTADNMLDLYSGYAETLWAYEAGGVLLVPDAPVDVPAAVLGKNDIIKNSFRLLGSNMRQSPTTVRIDYRQPTGTAESWPQEPAVQKLPGVEDGLIDDVPSNVIMPGLHRASEANRKALTRLRRLSYPSRFAWQMMDEGIKFQRGDVVQLPNIKGMVDRLVRILSIEMVKLGRYQITAEHYDANLYPDDYDPGVTASWPVGTAVFFTGTEIPAGWERWLDADGLMLFGASETYPAGTIVGDGSIDVSGTTASAGGHTGENDDGYGNGWIMGKGGGGSGADDFNAPEPPHTHDYETNTTITRIPYNRREVIISKVGGSGDIPAGAQIMANGTLISSVLTEVSTALGRMAAAGDAANSGSSLSFNVTSGQLTFTEEPDHDHDSGFNVNGDASPNFGPRAYQHEPAGGHGHWGSVTVTLEPKRRRMVFYQANAAVPAQIGAVGMYIADPEDLAGTGFHLCNGENGTVDLEDYFIERSTSAVAGSTMGNHNCTWTGVTNTVAPHDHEKDTANLGNRDTRKGSHKVPTGDHFHAITGESAYRAPGYSIYFIQYTGVV